MINYPTITELMRVITQSDLDKAKAGLLKIIYPSKVKGLRFNVETADILPENNDRLIEGLKRFEYVRPIGTIRLISLPNVATLSEIQNALSVIFLAMKKAGTYPNQWTYHLNESYQPIYGLTPEMACISALTYRAELDKRNLATRKLYLCATSDHAEWKPYMELCYNGKAFPRDLHFYWDKDDKNAINISIITAEQVIKKYTMDVICTEAGIIESKTAWGDWQCHDWTTSIIPARAIIAIAYKYGRDIAWHTLFGKQTTPASGSTSYGLWSNNAPTLTPKQHPILQYMYGS